MPDTAYPLLHQRRKRHGVNRAGWQFGPRAMAAGVILVAAMIVIGLVLVAPRRDGRQLLGSALGHLDAGDYTAARDEALAATTAWRAPAAAQAVLARAELELGNGLAAEAALDRAAAAGMPPGRLHQLRAQARLLQGDVDGALAQAAQTDSRYAGYATRIRARAMAASGDPVGAEDTLTVLLTRVPSDGAAWTDLGRLRLSDGNVGGAAQAAARAVAMARTDPAALTLQGDVMRTRYGLTAALPWFRGALRRDPAHVPALIAYAAALGDSGLHAEMLAATRRALAARPGQSQALYLQAVLATRAGKDALARRLLQRTGGAIDGVPGVLLLGGALDYRGHADTQAAAKWRRLLDMQPTNLTARRLLATALLRSGDPRSAIETLAPLTGRADADSYTLRLAARAFERVDDRATAAALLDRAGRPPGPPAPFASTTALATLLAKARQSPGDPAPVVALIRRLIVGDDPADAALLAGELAGDGPGAPAAQIVLGDTLVAAGRAGEAGAAYARAADLAFDAPTLLRLLDTLGGDPRQRAAVLSLYLAQNPRSIAARLILGHWQVAAGEHVAAVATLERVRRATGNRNAMLLADLALAQAGAGDAAVAVRYARAASALAPFSAAVAHAHARALAAAEQRGAARQLIAKAASLAPDDATIRATRLAIGG